MCLYGYRHFHVRAHICEIHYFLRNLKMENVTQADDVSDSAERRPTGRGGEPRRGKKDDDPSGGRCFCVPSTCSSAAQNLPSKSRKSVP